MLYIFFFNDTATTEIYTLSLHDALPISCNSTAGSSENSESAQEAKRNISSRDKSITPAISYSSLFMDSTAVEKIGRATSELQSRQYLVCRLLLEKKINQCLVYSLVILLI